MVDKMNVLQLVDQWVDDRDSLSDQQLLYLLEACESDPELSAQLKDHLLIHEALGRLQDSARQHFVGRVHKAMAMRNSRKVFAKDVLSGVRQRQEKRRTVLRTRSLTAGVLVVFLFMSGWWVLDALHMPRPQMHTIVTELQVAQIIAEPGALFLLDGKELKQGDWLRNGDVVQLAAGLQAQLDLGDGITIELQQSANFTVRKSEYEGWRCRLYAGHIVVNCRQPLDRPMNIIGNDVQVTVTGTVFFFGENNSHSEVAVERGSVLVTPLQGQPMPLSAGERFRQPRIKSEDFQRDRIFRFTKRWRGWLSEHPYACDRITMNDQHGKVDQYTFTAAGAWFSYTRRNGLDLSASDGLLLEFKGDGQGATYYVELVDAATPGKDGERFVAQLVDNKQGWRQVKLPWRVFQRRDEQLVNNPAEDGLQVTEVPHMAMWRATDGRGILMLRHWGTYSSVVK